MPDKKKPKGPQGKVRPKKSGTTAPAGSSLARENQMIKLAMDEAERQIRDGVASSQIITHFLKLGSETEKLNREKITNENALLKAKVDQIASQAKVEELYVKALTAMKTYSGEDTLPLDDLEYDA